MKCLVILCLILAGGLMAHGQLPDFPLHANGLLYSDTLMSRLRHLADSARSRVKPTDAEGDYYSPKLTTARVVRMDTGKIYGAFDDLKKGISFEAFVRKYPQAETDNRIMILLDERPGYQVAGNATYYMVAPTDYSASRIILPTDEHYRPIANPAHTYGIDVDGVGINGNCVYYLSREPHTYRGRGTNDPYVFAFYLDSLPTAVRLPETAARLIDYRNQMMDTSVGIYYKDVRSPDLTFKASTFGPAQNVFDNYIVRKEDSMVGAYRRTHAYENPRNTSMEDFLVKRRYIDSLVADTVVKRLLAEAVAEVREKKYRPFIYLERYMDAYSPEAALDIRRSWQEVPTCGMDHLTHRLYTEHIAYLAAETGNWPVFLQAQLSVAIDPDGQYPDLTGPGYRTYFLRELETLNIGVDEILLGNVLASSWPDANFYSARVIGRALALEGGDRSTLEETLLKLIADKGLDTYHRLAMHYLFLNYVSFLPADSWRNEALTKLERADETLPDYLSARIRVREEAVNNHGPVQLW